MTMSIVLVLHCVLVMCEIGVLGAVMCDEYVYPRHHLSMAPKTYIHLCIHTTLPFPPLLSPSLPSTTTHLLSYPHFPKHFENPCLTKSAVPLSSKTIFSLSTCVTPFSPWTHDSTCQKLTVEIDIPAQVLPKDEA
jgi:hypothetical protein